VNKRRIKTRTRVRVSSKICIEFNKERWHFIEVIHQLEKEYDLKHTSSRGFVAFFYPKDEQKLMLFLMRYGSYVVEKRKYYY
jgi:hypothetical protein